MLLTRTVVGSTGIESHQETHTSVTALYNGTEGAAFDPGGPFEGSWLTLAQPRLRKSIDEARTDVADVTRFVYYPNDLSVPEEWRGRLAATKNALGQITRFEDYDVFGHATRVVDPNGSVRLATYDDLGRNLTQVMKGITGCDTAIDALCASDVTTSRTYAGAGPLETESNANGIATYTYDSLGRVSTISRGPAANDLREQMEYSYDPATARKSMERVLARESGSWVEKKRESFSYDSFEQLQNVTHGDSTFVAYTYDPSGRVASVRDENHAAANTSYMYDSAGRLETVSQVLGSSTIMTDYAYDLHGNLSAVTDPNGNTTEYEYDDFGRMLRQISPVSGTTTYDYDESGNLLEFVDANSATTTRTYDALGRVLSSSSARTGFDSEGVNWTYDANTFGIGHPASMIDPTGSTQYRYNHRGALARETRTIDGQTYETRFGYDLAGNRSTLTYPSGRMASTTFDFANRPNALTVDASDIVTAATYAPFGPMMSVTYGNGTTKTMTFDKRYRPQTNILTGPAGTIASYSYGYDAAGNITSLHDQLDSTYNRDFGYDDLNRLTTTNSGTSLWGTGAYVYDAMGNMQSATLGTAVTSFSYDGTKPKLVSITENGILRPVTYDPVGNEKTAGSSNGSYSPRNSLIAFEDAQYAYDGRGVRTTTSVPAEFVELAVPASIGSGRTVEGSVRIRHAAPVGGASVSLTSGTALATAPGSVTVAAGQTEATFDIVTSSVEESTSGTISATYQGVALTAGFDLISSAVASLSFDHATVRGGQTSTGTVLLTAPAPAGGATVLLTSTDSTHLTVPSSLTIAAGLDEGTFVATAPVAVRKRARPAVRYRACRTDAGYVQHRHVVRPKH